MSLKRNKNHSAEDFCATPLHFKLSDRTIARFNEKYHDRGWQWRRDVEKEVNYKTHQITFFHGKNSHSGEPAFRAFIPFGEGTEALKLGFALGRDQRSFFIFYLELVPGIPVNISDGLQEEYEIYFHEVRQNISDSESVLALHTQLLDLKISQQRKTYDVNKEIAIWNKYLLAVEKLMRDKTILLKVRNGKKNSQRSRYRRNKKGWYFEYELDNAAQVEELKVRLGEAMLPHQLQALELEREGGHVDLRGIVKPEKAYLDWVSGLAAAHFFKLNPPFAEMDRLMKFRFLFRFREKKARAEMLEVLLGAAQDAGCTVRREHETFLVDTWKNYRILHRLVEARKAMLKATGLPRVRFSMTHGLDDEAVQHGLCKKAEGLLRGQAGVRELKVPEPGKISVLTQKSGNLAQKKALAGFDLLSLEARFSYKPEEEKLKLRTGMRQDNGHVFIREKHLSALKKQFSQLQTDNPEAVFAGFDQAEIQWEFSLCFLEERQQILNKVANVIRNFDTVSFQWPAGTVQPGSEAAFRNWKRRVEAIDPHLTLEVESIAYQVEFCAGNPASRTELLRVMEKQLKDAMGNNLVECEKDGDAQSLYGMIRIGQDQEIGQINALLSGMENANLELPVPDVQGITRMYLSWDEKNFEKFLNEKWNDIKHREVKFLTKKEKEAYQAEIAGEGGGTYRGGEQIGKLVGLRNGKARVQLEDADISIGKFQSGFLLPIFIGDLAQHKRLKDAIRAVRYPKLGMPVNHNLANFIFDPSMARPIRQEEDVTSDYYWKLKHALNEAALNNKQREAVWKALHAQDMVLIQGPPGTGKTTVIAEIIWQMLQDDPECRILVSSQAHLAVDNVLQRLYKKNLIRPLRVASSAHAKKAVEPEGQKYVQEIIEEWAAAAPGSKAEAEVRENAIQAWMDRSLIQMKSEKKYAAVQAKWNEMLSSPKPDVKSFFCGIYLENVNVVAATCLECGRRDFKENFSDGFDAVIVDEASKATPPEMLIPMVLGRKVIIIGDHKQLPPMVEERRIEEVLLEMGEKQLANELEEIKTSQFEKLFQAADESVRVTLKTQYRMHEDIMRVIDSFYEEVGGLECGIKATMNLPDFQNKGSRWHGIKAIPLIDPDTHVVWLDVNGPEINHRPSFSNDGEVEAIRALLTLISEDKGFQTFQSQQKSEGEKEVGMISFYGKQVEKLQDVVEEFRGRVPIRLRTVDKFQGMERNIMIVSTVRSDTQIGAGKEPNPKTRPNRSIGFARDYRRVNVAFSRARHLLIIVGNENHFSRANEVYKKIEEVVGRHGARIDESQLK